MKRKGYVFSVVVVTLAALSGCSSGPATSEAKSGPARTPDKIQGKVQVVLNEATSADAALNAGGQSVYLWEGVKRYRLFFKNKFEVDAGKEYAVEGTYAQKLIDELGDPDKGKNGYPLPASCERVIRVTWPNLPFDVTDGHASVLRTRVKRYPARPVFLVTKITPVTKEGDAADAKKVPEKELPVVTVAAEKQQAQLTAGPKTVAAPLWEPAGGTTRCKVVIDKDGKISELETGSQLCEAVPWAEYKYQPPVQNGKPVTVQTEVEVTFEARK